MSILLSGDFHANAKGELSFVTKKNLLRRFGERKYASIKYHVILGDGGFLWPGNEKTDEYNLKVLAHREFPVLCVVGNHDPILGRDDLQEVDVGLGDAVYQVAPNVYYLKRGKVYDVDGFKFLVLGGALSVDRSYRVPGESWWPREYWSEEEKNDVLELVEHDDTFDYVLSHTGPHRVNVKIFERTFGESSPDAKKFTDEVALLNDMIDARIKHRGWWCGHWHVDKYYYDVDKDVYYNYLYEVPVVIEE